MLQKFYADQDRYSFAFQMMAYISRLALLKQAVQEHPTATFITERSIYVSLPLNRFHVLSLILHSLMQTDKLVFAKMLYDQGHIEDVNYQIYLKWFENFLEESNLSRVVYVKTDPGLCHQRIARRARTGESVIPLAYLEDCHNYHENMLDYLSKSETLECSEQLVINGNVDIIILPIFTTSKLMI